MSRQSLIIGLLSLLGLALGLAVLVPLLWLAPPDKVFTDDWEEYAPAAGPPAGFCEAVRDSFEADLDVRLVGESSHVEEYASQVTCSLRGAQELTALVTLRRFSERDLPDADPASDHIETLCHTMDVLNGGNSRFQWGPDRCTAEERDGAGQLSGEFQTGRQSGNDVLRVVLTSTPEYAARLPAHTSGIQSAVGALD